MYDFKRYSFPAERKKNSFIYGFFSALCIIVIVIFSLISDKPQGNTEKVAVSNLSSVENKLIVDGIKMEDENPPVESEGEIIFDDNFDDDIDVSKIIMTESSDSKKSGSKKKEKSFNINELKKKDKRWHLSTYTVKKNDTIWKIAQKFNVDFRLIILANDLENQDLIKPGKTILIPNKNGVIHTVKKGETLTSIARMYGVQFKTIAENNKLGHPDDLKSGKELFIPDVSSVVHIRDASKTIVKSNQNKTNTTEKISLSLLWPVQGKITSGFGDRKNPIGKGRQFHCGLDISCEPGTPIKAALCGTVIFSGWKDGYGNVVVVRHEKGYITVYGHNSDNLVQEGDKVAKGQVIAKSGMTGSVTGAHLHFEVRKYLTPLNPLRFLKEK